MIANGTRRKVVSIVCPVLNEEQAIPIFYRRLLDVLDPLSTRYDFELLFVNNRSTDKSIEVLLEYRERNPSVQILTMSRNFGYQASVQAGMLYASGDAIVVIDVDCEDPPELIPQFIAKWEEGYDVVCGIRKDRVESWIKKMLRNAFYRLLQTTADMDIVLYMAEFALISSVVRDAIVNNRNTFPFLRAEIGYVGFSRFELEYSRQARIAGRSSYNFFHMISFGMAGLLTSSTFLMRLAAYAFPLIVAANLVLVAYAALFQSLASVGFLVVADLVYIIFLLTVHGVYLARVYKNAMGRPIFVVDPTHSYLNKEISEKYNQGRL